MNSKYYASLLVTAVMAFMGCKKSSGPAPAKNVDVYLAGNVTTADNHLVAAYWKNGVIAKLTDGTKNANALGIVVNGSDVYVVGNENFTGGIYWKNGVATKLGANTDVSSITIDGNDVYVYGENSAGSAYWKNGILNQVSNIGLSIDCRSCIAVRGNDVYIVGRTNSGLYWKNDIPVSLPSDLGGDRVSSILLNGSDIYLAGTTNYGDVAYWKNGVATVQPQRSYGLASAIAVNGSDVYLSGSSYASSGNLVATYWKNNVATQLTDGIFSSTADAIALNGDDVYVAVNPGGYWHKGVLTQIANSRIYGIAIVRR